MPELDTSTLDKLMTAFFRERRQSISELAEPYTIDELLRAFENLRRGMQRLLNGLTEEQINFNPDPNTYSLSEIVSHLVAAQGNTYNAFLDIVSSTRPHVDPVPRNPGGGAEKGLTGAILQARLQKATDELVRVVREMYDPKADKRIAFPPFGEMTSKGWMFFQLAHDLDHLKQAQVLRRSQGFPSSRRTQGA
ncbi:MAG: DinB family protein [Anaerolineae bacterium]|nr:DinB family protein [Anaerolineae bacterium]